MMLLSAVVAIAALSRSALAVKGVISDTITADSASCMSSCGLNNDCFMVLFDSDCNECWQLDCAVGNQPVEGLQATGKASDATAPECDDGVKFPEKREECKEESELVASTTSDAGAKPTETSSGEDEDEPNNGESNNGDSSGGDSSNDDSSNDDSNNDDSNNDDASQDVKDTGFRAKGLSWSVLAGGVVAATLLAAA